MSIFPTFLRIQTSFILDPEPIEKLQHEDKERSIELVSGKNSHEGVPIDNTCLMKWSIYHFNQQNLPLQRKAIEKLGIWRRDLQQLGMFNLVVIAVIPVLK